MQQTYGLTKGSCGHITSFEVLAVVGWFQVELPHEFMPVQLDRGPSWFPEAQKPEAEPPKPSKPHRPNRGAIRPIVCARPSPFQNMCPTPCVKDEAMKSLG